MKKRYTEEQIIKAIKHIKPNSVTLAGVEQTGIVGWYFSL